MTLHKEAILKFKRGKKKEKTAQKTRYYRYKGKSKINERNTVLVYLVLLQTGWFIKNYFWPVNGLKRKGWQSLGSTWWTGELTPTPAGWPLTRTSALWSVHMYAHTPTHTLNPLTNYCNLKKNYFWWFWGQGSPRWRGMNMKCSPQTQALFPRHPKGRKQKGWTVRRNTVGFKLTFILTHSHNCPISEMT